MLRPYISINNKWRTMPRELLKGNQAIAEAAIRAGLEAYFGYPITPQTEILEHLSHRMPELGRAFVQAESEVAAINMVYGAACTGVRVMIYILQPRCQPDAGRPFLHRRHRGAGCAGQRDARRTRAWAISPPRKATITRPCMAAGMAITTRSCWHHRPCRKPST